MNLNIDSDSYDGAFCNSWLASHPLMQRLNDFHSRNHNLAMPNSMPYPFNENRMRDVHGEQTVRNMEQNCKVYNLNEIVKR